MKCLHPPVSVFQLQQLMWGKEESRMAETFLGGLMDLPENEPAGPASEEGREAGTKAGGAARGRPGAQCSTEEAP